MNQVGCLDMYSLALHSSLFQKEGRATYLFGLCVLHVQDLHALGCSARPTMVKFPRGKFMRMIVPAYIAYLAWDVGR